MRERKNRTNKSKSRFHAIILGQPVTLIILFSCLIICLEACLVSSLLYAAEEHQIYFPRKLINVKWGLAPEEFGLTAGKEIEKIGPLTFALDEEENIYILDFVKKNIKKFNKEGFYLENLGSDITGSALAIGRNGQLFVLYDQGLSEYSPSGELVGYYPIANEIKIVQGYGTGIKTDIDNNLYYYDTSQKTYQLGKAGLMEKKMEILNKRDQLASEKKGSTGVRETNWFQAKRKNKHNATIHILSNKGEILNEIFISSKGVLGTVLFLSEDENHDIYVEVGRITEKYTHLEVWKYDLKGNLLSKIELPNDYYTTVFKKLEVDQSGNIYQMVTSPEGVELVKWEQK